MEHPPVATRIVLTGAALTLFAGCQDLPVGGGGGRAGGGGRRHDQGRLSARPGEPTKAFRRTGLVRLPLGPKAGLIYVPPAYRPGRPAPVAVVLHGAGGGGGGMRLFRDHADRVGLIMVGPRSRGRSWDVIYGAYGADVVYIDRTLRWVFDRFAVDPGHLAIAGFSDGASYALSLGRINGDLFSHLIGFSPGFLGPGEAHGDPAVFVSHGTDDETLPIDRTSRRLVPELRQEGLAVRYVEFDGKHAVPPDVEAQALRWFLR